MKSITKLSGSKSKGQMNIASLVDAATAAFVTLAISGIVVAVVLDLSIANDTSLVQSLSTDIEDGMVQLAGLVVLIVVIVVLGFLRRRA